MSSNEEEAKYFVSKEIQNDTNYHSQYDKEDIDQRSRTKLAF